MGDMRLGLVEARFADIIWENAPLTTRELVNLCANALNWKRTTTYTVLKRLCQRGIFSMQDGEVTVLLSKDRFHTLQSEQFVNENFSGSLPDFIAAFASGKSLKPNDLERIQKILETCGEESK